MAAERPLREPRMPGSCDVDELYRSHARPLWAMFYARCCDPELALEAVHEAFVRLQKQGAAAVREPRAWLLRVGRNWLIDQSRRGRREEPPLDDDCIGSAIEPPATMIANELQGQVRAALATLREEDREALVLRYSLDWSSERIAGALQTSATAVDMRLTRARRRLAAALQQVGVGHEPV